MLRSSVYIWNSAMHFCNGGLLPFYLRPVVLLFGPVLNAPLLLSRLRGIGGGVLTMVHYGTRGPRSLRGGGLISRVSFSLVK